MLKGMIAMEVATRINGHSAEEPPIAPPTTHKIELYRVRNADAIFIQTLTSDYLGCFTHYRKQSGSEYCGANCKHPDHGIKRLWKGYVPVLINVPNTDRWVPFAFEITEHLELDLRGVWGLNQTWEIYRDMTTKTKNGPMYGRLHKDPPWPKLPLPFNILPCLQAVYHVDVVKLDQKSPLPARVYVEPFQAPAPEVTRPKPIDQVPEGFSFEEEFKKRQRIAAENRPAPSDKKRR